MTQAHFPHLFSPLTIAGTTLRNRIVSTGHETHLAHGGALGDEIVAYHEARARGGAGLIIVEVALPHRSGVFVADPIRVDSDDCIPGYARLAKVVQGHGAALVAQLFHPGREMLASEDGTEPVSYSASATPNERFHVMPRQMPLEMITEVVSAFGDAARRMQRAGLNGVEIVGSHGYLPAQFLNPHVNRRTDAYGGSLENRTRFIREIAADIRAKTDPDFVIGLRLSGDEKSHDGLEQGEALEACARIAEGGDVSYLSVVAGSSGTLAGSIHIAPPMYEEVGYTAPLGAAVRKRTGLPTIVTGRLNQPQDAERVIASGQADLCGMTRAMICDPEIGEKARTGRLDDIRACIACNQACIGHFHAGYPISCIQNPVSGRETVYGEMTPADTPRRVLVVGGGPAGMKAAATAAARGHAVTLLEKGPQLGGQARLAQMLPHRAEFGGIITNLTREMELAGAQWQTGVEVTQAVIREHAPDAVIVATGAAPRWPEFEGRDDAHVVDAWQVLLNQANVGKSVVVADWRADWIGIGIAELLAQNGHAVKLAVNGYMPGQTIQMYVRDASIGRLHSLGVEMVPYVRLFGADEDSVYLQHIMNNEPVICEGVDTLVLCQGHEPVNSVEEMLREMGVAHHLAGDCIAPRTAEEAVFEGLKVGMAV
ncbi:2,4-dienoyl-CoA reductase [NADPH] [Candidatus Rhodobacter oscarellae]|uniref:2,4-dienoyl-CoA reductase [NADPH] n=1 Tax=Candidatus Rhodobacter oscarellae TaxID=1675527 RepID=A0A0J9E1T8_9RHOB|nr:FAD-dependent oxidoreductase [Candidatus Rhodobacter lobularis]KMW56675.1 2,4-dienoyl-CoA reductase [NADPH] [Candidatus Rhodobacter lobularis]